MSIPEWVDHVLNMGDHLTEVGRNGTDGIELAERYLLREMRGPGLLYVNAPVLFVCVFLLPRLRLLVYCSRVCISMVANSLCF